MVDVDADALKDLVRRANFLPYLSYGSPHDLSILEKISGYYVGRPTVLGNPYTLEAYTRTDAIARYRIWLRQQWHLHGEVHAALLQLARRYKERGELTLACWCAPQRCHAEVIREAVLGIVQHGLVESQPVHQAPPAGPHRPHGGLMKLIIAGSRTFTDYQRLCQVLAPDRHRIAQVITGGARISSATVGRGSTRSGISSSGRNGSASGSPQVCGAITRWPRLETSSSRAGTANRQAPRT